VTVYIGTSWKMNKTLDEARAYVETINAAPTWPDTVQPFVLPPHTVLSTVSAALDPATGVWIGAQNAHWAAHGPYTGEVSMTMVKDAGAGIVEIGHSERRELFNETDRSVNLKIVAALAAGLVPLLCVGEGLETRSRGEALRFVLAQVDAAFADFSADDSRKVLVAYEPVWAIGDAGIPARPEDVADVISAISSSRDLRGVLYGGERQPRQRRRAAVRPRRRRPLRRAVRLVRRRVSLAGLPCSDGAEHEPRATDAAACPRTVTTGRNDDDRGVRTAAL